MSNKKLVIVASIMAVIVLVAVIFLIIFSNNDNFLGIVKNPDGEKFANEYEKLNEQTSEEGKVYPEVKISSNNIIKYSNISEILSIMEDKRDAVVYFGKSTCIYCRSAVQILIDTANETELDTIYYLDIDKDTDRYDELANVLGEELTILDGNQQIINIPLVIFIVDGKVVSYNQGTLFSQNDPYQKLDASQIEGLSEIYRYGINDVISSKKLKNS